MAVPTLEQLYAAKSREEVLASALQVATEIDLPVTAWQPLEPGRELIEVCAAIVASYTAGGFEAAASKLLSFATGEWLTLTAFEVFDTTRRPAAFGECVLRITNVDGSSIPPFTVDSLRVQNSSTGATYSNTEAGTLPAVVGATLDLAIRADESGVASNAAVGAIDLLTSSISGITVSNTTACVGADEESDEDLRERCREGNARLSPNGPSDAYSYFAKSAVRGDGSPIGITRVKVYEPPSPRGVAIVYVAGPSGAIDPADVATVQTYLLENVVPTGFTVTTASASELSVTIAASLYLRKGSTAGADQIKEAALAALLAYFQTVPIGGTELILGQGGLLFLEAINATLFDASDQIVNAVVTSHSADLPLALNQVPDLLSTVDDFTVLQAVG